MNISEASIARKSKYLNESILPPVQYLLRSALKVLPRSSKIIAQPEVCRKEAQIPAYASETGFDSDLVLFVTILDNTSYGFDFPFVEGYTCDNDDTTHRFKNAFFLILTPLLGQLSGFWSSKMSIQVHIIAQLR